MCHIIMGLSFDRIRDTRAMDSLLRKGRPKNRQEAREIFEEVLGNYVWR